MYFPCFSPTPAPTATYFEHHKEAPLKSTRNFFDETEQLKLFVKKISSHPKQKALPFFESIYILNKNVITMKEQEHSTYTIFHDSLRRPVHPPTASRSPMPGQRSGADHASWIKSKRCHDDAGQYWKIDGNLYDLTNFQENHPGGQQWIQWTRGTDCTAAFESHHLDSTRVRRLLQQFFVRSADTTTTNVLPSPPLSDDVTLSMISKENGIARARALLLPPTAPTSPSSSSSSSSSVFSFNDTDFYSVLRRRVLSTLLQRTNSKTVAEATGPSRSMRWSCSVVVGQFLVIHAAAATFGSWLLSALAGVALVGCWGVGHNAMHQADRSWGFWRFALDLTTWSSRTTRITHCLSHHQYPNMHQDWEVTSIEKSLSFLPDSIDSNRTPAFMSSYGLLVIGATAWMTALKKLKWLANAIKSKGWRNVDLDEWCHLLPSLQLLHYIHHQGLIKGFALFVLQMGTYLAVFTPVGLMVHHSAKRGGKTGQLSHLDTASWHQGMENPESDYGRHAVAATSDFALQLSNGTFWGQYLSLCMFGYLNDHTAHHLFPSIDHSKHFLYREVMMNCFREFQIDYTSNDALSLLDGLRTMVASKQVHVGGVDNQV